MDIAVEIIKKIFLTWSLLMFLNVQGSACLDDNLKDNFNISDLETTTVSITSDEEVTKPDVECECIPFFQCNNDYGENIITLRLNVCEKNSDVCCPIPSQPKPETTTKPQALIRKDDCGIRNVESIGFRIFSGDEAGFGEFPWMVAVMVEEETEDISSAEPKFECGGSLVHPQVVLTAAHCVDQNMTQFRARAGEWDFKTTQEIYPHQDRKIQKIIIHEKYYRGTAIYDVALLILEEPYEKSENLGIICLPRPETILDQECIVTGWGKDATDGELNDVLRQVEMPLVPREECQAALRKTRLGKRFKLHESFICAGGVEGADSCEGDGGGPLICPIKDGKDMQYQQVGIVAWGINCGTETPGVYVDVALFVDWIEKQMDIYGFKPSFNQ